LRKVEAIMLGRTMSVLLVVSLLWAFPVSAADSQIVYDNSSTPTRGLHGEPPYAGDGFWPFTMNPNRYLGDEIVLSGDARRVVRVDVQLSSTGPTSLENLTLGLFSIAPGAYYPDALLWLGSLADILVEGPTAVTFTVPEIQVPDRFVWAVAGPDSETAGLAVFDPPTVGASPLLAHPTRGYMDYYLHSSGEDLWGFMYFEGDPVANFGATIWAVPEPSTLALAALGGIALIRRR
jgi:hypothetical protein